VTTPSHIGQYRIVRKIGAGGMGLVFLGEHTLLGRRAAIKTLLPSVAANREIVERFFNEARATSTISDPGVIQVFDFGYHVDGTAYIVMELLEGEALSARIDRLGRLALVDALRIGRQVAGSLAAAHAHAIVHRDLKPENIFLVGDAEAQGGERTKLLDFGICKLAGEIGDATLTQSGAMVGTPVYMSPEQCRGAGDVDHRSDIYAFGCLLFHMLTGRPPFIGDATGELIVAHLQDEPPPPSRFVPELPPAIDSVVLSCLAKAADDRYQSMTELQHVLGELHAQLDAVELPSPTVAPAVPLGRGFRSLYDGNFASRTGGARGSERTHAQVPWLPLSPSPMRPVIGASSSGALSGSGSGSGAGFESEHDELFAAPRRSRIPAVLACMVIGVAIGMASSAASSRDRGDGDAALAHAAPRSGSAGARAPEPAPARSATDRAAPANRAAPADRAAPAIDRAASATASAAGGTATAPGESNTAPGESNPSESTTAPGESTTAPGESNAAPGESNAAAPSESTTAPGESNAALGESTAAPGESNAAPPAAAIRPRASAPSRAPSERLERARRPSSPSAVDRTPRRESNPANSAGSEPVRSPRQIENPPVASPVPPPQPAAPPQQLQAPQAPPQQPTSAAPPSPATEDLYDTR
jgi:serine/threonine-protein kinase